MARKKDEPLVYNSFEELLDILAEERRKSLKRRKRVKIVAAILGLVFCLSMLMATVQHVHFSGFSSVLNVLPGIIAGMYALTAKQRKGLQALAGFNDIRAVPHLITALEYTDGSVKLTAANALPSLLPRLQASDAALLNRGHYAILNRALKNDLKIYKTNVTQLRVAILQSLQQVGDESSLPIVEELAEGKGKAVGHLEVRQAAQECLPYLRLRAENQHQTQTLLRASDGNMTGADMLLHPAMPQPDTALRAKELLRVPQSAEEEQAAARPVFAVPVTPPVEQELRLH